MRQKEKEQFSNDLQVSFGICREVVLAQLGKYSYRPGSEGIPELAWSIMLTFDMIVKSITEQGFKPVQGAEKCRSETVEKVRKLIIEYSSGQLSKIITATKITGAIVEAALKVFGTETQIFINTLN